MYIYIYIYIEIKLRLHYPSDLDWLACTRSETRTLRRQGKPSCAPRARNGHLARQYLCLLNRNTRIRDFRKVPQSKLQTI